MKEYLPLERRPRRLECYQSPGNKNSQGFRDLNITAVFYLQRQFLPVGVHPHRCNSVPVVAKILGKGHSILHSARSYIQVLAHYHQLGTTLQILLLSVSSSTIGYSFEDLFLVDRFRNIIVISTLEVKFL